MQELLDKNEVRIGGAWEMLWIRGRILTAAVVVGVGAAYAAWLFLQQPLSWWWVALAASIPLSAIGMNLSYHPYFSHGAFKTGRLFKIVMGMWGAVNLRGPVIDWAAHHRRHHKYTDLPGRDPHTPWEYGRGAWPLLKGMGWVFIGEKLSRVRTVNQTWAADLLADRDLLWLNRLYDLFAVASLALPAAVAYAITGDPIEALHGFVILGCARAAMAFVMISVVVNGLCHLVGAQPFRVADQSRNIGWLTLPTFGGSLHHNHHVFPKSLKVSLNGELDPFDAVFLLLEKSGIIRDVRRPAAAKLEAARVDASSQAAA